VKVVARFWTFAALASLFLLLLFFLLLPFVYACVYDYNYSNKQQATSYKR
jgi:hypothetical protein